jgi:hypothetical protein
LNGSLEPVKVDSIATSIKIVVAVSMNLLVLLPMAQAVVVGMIIVVLPMQYAWVVS